MKFMNQVKRLAVGVLSVVMFILPARANSNSNSGPISAADQQAQEIDLTAKKAQQKVDLFTGSFGYSIPIACAPARNGSEPNLVLAYASAGELGWCGMGWDLNIGYIERNTREGFPIQYSTDTPAYPLNQYDDTQGFILNLFGKESKLFAMATNGSVVEYRAEVDTDFLRCFLNTANNNWTVYDKGGNVYYLGESPNTRVVNPKSGWSGYSGTFRWALDQVVTATGDWTTIGYTTTTSPNTGLPERILYPTQITYNGHTNYNGYSANSVGANTITFQTELRTNDWRFSYRWGFRTEQCRRLTNILCSVGAQKVWSYSLKYGVSATTGRSLLNNVVVYGFDANNNASAYLTNTFAYQGNPNGVSFGSTIVWTNMILNTPGSSSGSYQPEVTQVYVDINNFSWTYTLADLVDMDGDGLPDRVSFDSSTSPNRYQVQKNLGMQANGSGSFAATRYAFGPTSTGSGSASDANPFPDGSGYAKLNSPYGRIRDLNGDGLPDRVMDYWKPFNMVNPPTPYTNFTIAFNTGSGFSSPTRWAITNIISPIDADAAYLTYETVEGGGSVTFPGSYTVNVGVGLFDISGSGLPDRVMTYFSPYGALTNLYFQANTGTNFGAMRCFPYKSQNYNGTGTSQDNKSVSIWAGIETTESHFIDINGDGLPDHIMCPINPTNGYGEMPHPASFCAVEFNNGYSFESTNTSTGVPGAFDCWPGIVSTVSNAIIYNSTTFYGDEVLKLPFVGLYDLNGDGLPDRVLIDPATWGTTNTAWLVYLNNGHGFNSTPVHVTGISCQGRFLLTGSPWWSVQGTVGLTDADNGNYGSAVTTMIDINGDGLLDRVMAPYYNPSLTPTANYFLVQLNDGPYPDLLTNINNGIGGTIAVTYNPSTAYDNRVDTSNANSVSHMPYPRYVTATMTASDGINSPQTTTYSYGGGYYDGARREFHGFAVVTNTDPTLRYTVTYFHTGGGRNYAALGEYQDTNSTTGAGNFAKAGMAYRVETYGNDNALYHVTVNQVDQTSLGNGRYFPFTTLSFDCDYPGPKVTATDFAYDPSTGNLTNKLEYGQVTGFSPTSVGSFTFTDTSTDNRYYNTHFTPIGTYIVDRPDTVTLTDAGYNVIHETDYSYNSGGTLATKLTRIAAGYYATDSYANYNAYGLVGQTTDPVGVQTAIIYDSTYTYPATTTVGGSFTTTTSYDPRSGQLTLSTDPAGLTVSNRFDSFCRPTEVDKIPIGGGSAIWQKKTSYPSVLKPIASGVATNYADAVVNDGLSGGVESRTYIDGFGRAIQTRTQGENGNFRVVSTAYDGRGNAFLTTWPSFIASSNYSKPTSGLTASWIGYDAAGRAATNRPVTVTFSSGAFSSVSVLTGDTGSPLGAKTWSYVNGTDPWWIVFTDEDGQVRRYGLDAFGRTNQIQEVDGSSTYTTTLKYDLADNLTNIVNANSENIYWAYNDDGGLVAMADPYLGQWNYQRDYANRLRSQTDGRGDVIQLSYINPATGQQDPLGRVQTKLIYSTNYTTHTLTLFATVTNIYDASDDGNYTVYKGLLYKTIDNQGWEKNGYDARERTVKTTRYLNINSNAYTTGYTLDDGDNTTAIAYPNNGPTVNYSYWHGGSINLVSLNGGGYNYYTANAAGFDEFGHVTNFTYGSTLTTTRSYYSASKRLQGISSGTVFSRSYKYTAGDDLTNISGTGLTNATTVTYYNLHRIKTYTGLTGNYGYDPTGNITNNIEGGGSSYSYATPRKQAVRTAFGYTNLYDLCGNMVVRHAGTTNAQALSYDPENHLSVIAAAGVFSDEFGYAADGSRLWKRVNQNPTNIQVWIGNLYEEKSDTNGNRKVLFHVFAGGQQVCTFETNSPLMGGSDSTKVGYYYHQDNLGSSSVLSSSSGSQIEVNAYYPFGRVQTASPQASFQVSRRFDGQIFDAESGLYWFATQGEYGRPVDVDLGRFIQADDRITDLSNPQSYNRYSFCLNDPLRYNDPDGHGAIDDALLNTETLKSSYQLMTMPDTGLNKAWEIPVGVIGMAAGTADAAFNFVSLGGKGVVEGGLKEGIKAGVKELGKEGEKAAADAGKTVTRYMSKEEAELAKKSGEIPNVGRDGKPRPTHVTTDSPLDSASKAQKTYALPEKPTHQATVPAERAGPLEPAPSGPKTTGGGSQNTVPRPIPVKPAEIHELGI
jgi:RHS repeat-associated protein